MSFASRRRRRGTSRGACTRTRSRRRRRRRAPGRDSPKAPRPSALRRRRRESRHRPRARPGRRCRESRHHRRATRRRRSNAPARAPRRRRRPGRARRAIVRLEPPDVFRPREVLRGPCVAAEQDLAPVHSAELRAERARRHAADVHHVRAFGERKRRGDASALRRRRRRSCGIVVFAPCKNAFIGSRDGCGRVRRVPERFPRGDGTGKTPRSCAAPCLSARDVPCGRGRDRVRDAAFTWYRDLKFSSSVLVVDFFV